jgi:hypothetical protein
MTAECYAHSPQGEGPKSPPDGRELLADHLSKVAIGGAYDDGAFPLASGSGGRIETRRSAQQGGTRESFPWPAGRGADCNCAVEATIRRAKGRLQRRAPKFGDSRGDSWTATWTLGSERSSTSPGDGRRTAPRLRVQNAWR